MLVYDITNEKSFDNIKNWIRNIEEVGHAPLMSRDFCYFQSSRCSELDLTRSSKKCLYDVITGSCDLLYNEVTDSPSDLAELELFLQQRLGENFCL